MKYQIVKKQDRFIIKRIAFLFIVTYFECDYYYSNGNFSFAEWTFDKYLAKKFKTLDDAMYTLKMAIGSTEEVVYSQPGKL